LAEAQRETGKSFLVLFFKKELLPFLALNGSKEVFLF
jgi:hypothetical protein